MVTMMTAAIQENFHMNILLLLPAVAVIVMAVCKCPSIPTLMVSTLVAVVLAMLVQGQSLSGILNILDSGFSIDTALPEFNRLVNRGGLQSMLWTAALASSVCCTAPSRKRPACWRLCYPKWPLW